MVKSVKGCEEDFRIPENSGLSDKTERLTKKEIPEGEMK